MTDNELIQARQCQECERLRKERDQAQAACAEMRKALLFIRDECDWENIMDDGGDDRIGPACTKALSSDCGKGWVREDQIRQEMRDSALNGKGMISPHP